MLSDEWLPRYRLLENFTAKWNGNGNGNAYDRGDCNSSFALRAVELKTSTYNRLPAEDVGIETDPVLCDKHSTMNKDLLL